MLRRFSTCGPPPTAKIIAAVVVVVVMVATVSSDKVDRLRVLPSFNPFYHGSLAPTIEVENAPTHAQVEDADEFDRDPRMRLISLLRKLAGGGGDMWIQNGKRSSAADYPEGVRQKKNDDIAMVQRAVRYLFGVDVDPATRMKRSAFRLKKNRSFRLRRGKSSVFRL